MERTPQQSQECFQKLWDSPVKVIRIQQDGGFFKETPYPSYPFLMIQDQECLYLHSGALPSKWCVLVSLRTIKILFPLRRGIEEGEVPYAVLPTEEFCFAAGIPG